MPSSIHVLIFMYW